MCTQYLFLLLLLFVLFLLLLLFYCVFVVAVVYGGCGGFSYSPRIYAVCLLVPLSTVITCVAFICCDLLLGPLWLF